MNVDEVDEIVEKLPLKLSEKLQLKLDILNYTIDMLNNILKQQKKNKKLKNKNVN